ncbi:hypothetical protein Pmani_006152 [Petrolisthes manimaculis]|uniref:Alpha-1,3-glucosyltransferase n=1 Tax=Petrolisthes manimaculis TaxID=1843537 RepID=A0AAE1QCC5_9EUCA|nr:hypothetical protein Pmani_006152 [Petrolisthes manimaculis]
MFWFVVLVLSCLKFLLLPAYRSTDFEVHRNWMAITYSLPLDQWYVNETSEWTLDYPPLFAWFEWVLARVACYFDPNMLKVTFLNYASTMTVLYMRLAVIFTDLVYAYGVRLCSEEVAKSCKKQHSQVDPIFLVLFSNGGLLLVDHIHYQYNGFLSGILFISIARLLQKREIESAFWFAVLLNLKHIYLYVAPAYFVYLLRSYCLATTKDGRVCIRPHFSTIYRLVSLGATVIGVFAISFGPFIAKGQLTQVLSRLFPFKRGLSHAYWAPNFWALYNFADKALSFTCRKMGLVTTTRMASMTDGLVRESQHVILPSIPPLVTLILTVISILPCVRMLWNSPHNPWHFVRALILCAFGSFMFGWHVHEKAILLVILPLGLVCWLHKAEAKVFVFLSIVGHFSLFPLFFTKQETPIKVCVLLLHGLYTSHVLGAHFHEPRKSRLTLPICSRLETKYLLGFIPIFLFQEVQRSAQMYSFHHLKNESFIDISVLHISDLMYKKQHETMERNVIIQV